MGDAKPIVGIIDDSGLKLDHPDVLLNVWINEGELPAGMRANGAPGTGADFDGDGVVTFRDLNIPGYDPFCGKSDGPRRRRAPGRSCSGRTSLGPR